MVGPSSPDSSLAWKPERALTEVAPACPEPRCWLPSSLSRATVQAGWSVQGPLRPVPAQNIHTGGHHTYPSCEDAALICPGLLCHWGHHGTFLPPLITATQLPRGCRSDPLRYPLGLSGQRQAAQSQGGPCLSDQGFHRRDQYSCCPHFSG